MTKFEIAITMRTIELFWGGREKQREKKGSSTLNQSYFDCIHHLLWKRR